MKHHLPEFKGPIEGYVVNYLKRNLWRIRPTHDREDALQEAYAVFLRCAARYPLVDTPEHFMALFKTAWEREMVDLSLKASLARQLVPESTATDEEGEEYRKEVPGDLDNEGVLAVMIRQAPVEVVMVLNLFLNAPQELLDLAFKAWRKSGHYNELGDKAVARMLGLSEDSRPITTTKEYFEDK